MTYHIMTVFAHPDDETFSTGGTIAKHVKKGEKAISVCLTTHEERIEEFKQATKILGARGEMLSFKEITYHNFTQIKSSLINKILEFKPKTIITHIPYDYHFEHRMTHSIVMEAVEWAAHTTQFKEQAHLVENIYLAETTVLLPFPQILVDISDVWETKQKAISVYNSQLSKGGPGFYVTFQKKRSELRGIQAGVPYAEAYDLFPIPKVGPFKPRKCFEKLPTCQSS